MTDEAYVCRCGHSIRDHISFGANECNICDYGGQEHGTRVDGSRYDNGYCLRYDGPTPPARAWFRLRISREALEDMQPITPRTKA